MAKQASDKFCWVIKNFSLKCEKFFSDPIQIGDCKWRLYACLDGKDIECLSLYLEAVDFKSLSSGWRKFVKFRLTILPQSRKEPVVKETQHWFDKKVSSFGFPRMIPVTKLNDEKEGFVVNGELSIIAELDVLQVVGTSKKAAEANLMSMYFKKMIDINNKYLRAEHVEPKRSVPEREHNTLVEEFREKNKKVEAACRDIIYSLNQSLCKTPEELSMDDLIAAENTLAYMKVSGVDVDWLENKVENAKRKKEKEKCWLNKLSEKIIATKLSFKLI